MSGKSPASVAWQQCSVPPSVQTGGSGAAARARESVASKAASGVLHTSMMPADAP